MNQEGQEISGFPLFEGVLINFVAKFPCDEMSGDEMSGDEMSGDEMSSDEMSGA